eukprot:TRINITY_DN5007_c0_g1_i1.p1 TRINITY_DN5007_c0_g1~~TRINITY_DN5007_c0_g1_i1.p1  ORF type:complete len:1061 (-),score=201.83 TRINITY_DN5007_c0_g1_i1:87-3269(-)
MAFSLANGANPFVINLVSGDYVVGWQEFDGDQDGIFFEALSSTGAVVSGPTRVNGPIVGDQVTPQGTALPTGGFAITWEDTPTQTVQLSVYNTAYALVGQTTVNAGVLIGPSDPQNAVLQNGEIIVVWQAGGIVYYRRFTVVPLAPVATDVTVTTGTNPVVTALPASSSNTDFVIAAEGTDSSGSGIIAEVYTTSGTTVTITPNSDFVTGNQTHPSITSFPTGFVVVWEGPEVDGSQGIQGQQYLLGGVPVGSGFEVNSYIPNDQVDPYVFSLGSNGYFVTWQSYLQDGSGWGAYGQLYSLLGPTGYEISVTNTSTYGNQTHPVGVVSQTGLQSLIVFEDDSTGLLSLFANFVDTSANTCTVLFEQLVSLMSDEQSHPSLTSSGNNYFASWAGLGSGGSSSLPPDIFGRGFNTSGPATSELLLNSGLPTIQDAPNSAILANGDVVTVWESDKQDGTAYGVYATVTKLDGTVVVPEFQVNQVTTNSEQKPAVAALVGGGFVITWESQSPSTLVSNIFARVYDASNNPSTGEFQLDVGTLDKDVAVAPTPDGGFFAVWDGFKDSDTFGIFGTRYAFNGTWTATLPQTIINSDETGPQTNPAIGYNPVSNTFLISWESTSTTGDTDIYGRVFDAATTLPAITDQLYNSFTAGWQGNPKLAPKPDGGYVLTWESEGVDGSGYGVSGKYIASIGLPETTEFQINTLTVGDQKDQSVTVLADGTFITAWINFDTNGYVQGVVAQRRSCVGFVPILPSPTPSATPSRTPSASSSVTPSVSYTPSSTRSPTLSPSITPSTSISPPPSMIKSSTFVNPSRSPLVTGVTKASKAVTGTVSVGPPPVDGSLQIFTLPVRKSMEVSDAESNLHISMPDVSSSVALALCMGKIVQSAVGFFVGSVKNYFTKSQESSSCSTLQNADEQQSLSKDLIQLKQQTDELLREAESSKHNEQWLIYSLEDLADEIDDSLHSTSKRTASLLTLEHVLDFKDRLTTLVHDYDFVFTSSNLSASVASLVSSSSASQPTSSTLSSSTLVPQLSKPTLPQPYLAKPQQPTQHTLRAVPTYHLRA